MQLQIITNNHIMKKVSMVITFALFALTATAQIDTTAQIDVTQNVARTAKPYTFAEMVTKFANVNDFTDATLALWFSALSGVAYDEKLIAKFKTGEAIPLQGAETAIRKFIVNYEINKPYSSEKP